MKSVFSVMKLELLFCCRHWLNFWSASHGHQLPKYVRRSNSCPGGLPLIRKMRWNSWDLISLTRPSESTLFPDLLMPATRYVVCVCSIDSPNEMMARSTFSALPFPRFFAHYFSVWNNFSNSLTRRYILCFLKLSALERLTEWTVVLILTGFATLLAATSAGT